MALDSFPAGKTSYSKYEKLKSYFVSRTSYLHGLTCMVSVSALQSYLGPSERSQKVAELLLGSREQAPLVLRVRQQILQVNQGQLRFDRACVMDLHFPFRC